MKPWLALCLVCAVLPAQAAVMNDPSVGAVVDPIGSEEMDVIASGATAQASLEALADLRVLQDWSGSSGGSDIIAFSDPARPDIRIQTSFAGIFSDSRASAANLQTSGGGGNFAWSGSNGQTITIEFGDWDGSSFTPGAGVRAAGLTFVNFGAAYATASGQTVTYYDAADAVLSSQRFDGGADSSGGAEAYSGHLEVDYTIAKIVIAITRASGTSDIAIDDLAFTDAAPQPGSLQFSSASFAAPYDSGSVVVSVIRVGGSAGTVSIDYTTEDDTARAGSDYSARSGTLTWTQGQDASQSITIPLLNEPTSSGTAFRLRLSNPTGGAGLGGMASTTVNITEPVGEGFGSALAAYLNFDAAGAVADASVHRLGAETEGTGTSSSAMHGSARAFDGSGDRITLDPWTDVGALPDREAVSIALWFKADSTSGERVLFDDAAKHDALGARIANGNLEVTCLRHGKKVTVSSGFTATGTWQHLAVVKNGDSLDVYLNGNVLASVADLDAASASATDAGVGGSFLGTIDEFRVYRRALSAAEVTALQIAPTLTAGAVWRGHYFGQTSNTGDAADVADADRDGVANLLERAFATNPTDPASRAASSLSLSSIDGSSYLTLAYRRRAGGTGTTGVDYTMDGLRYSVEASAELDATWSNPPLQLVGAPVPIDRVSELVTLRALVPIGPEVPQFLRLKIAAGP